MTGHGCRLTFLSKSLCCWTHISPFLLLLSFCAGASSSDRSYWRIVAGLPKWSRVFCLIRKAFSAQIAVIIYMRNRYSHMVCQFGEVCPDNSSPDLVVISVTVVLFPSLQSPREMVSHCSWIRVDLYLTNHSFQSKWVYPVLCPRMCLPGWFFLLLLSIPEWTTVLQPATYEYLYKTMCRTGSFFIYQLTGPYFHNRGGSWLVAQINCSSCSSIQFVLGPMSKLGRDS